MLCRCAYSPFRTGLRGDNRSAEEPEEKSRLETSRIPCRKKADEKLDASPRPRHSLVTGPCSPLENLARRRAPKDLQEKPRAKGSVRCSIPTTEKSISTSSADNGRNLGLRRKSGCNYLRMVLAQSLNLCFRVNTEKPQVRDLSSGRHAAFQSLPFHRLL